MKDVVSIKSLVKDYGNVKAVKDITFCVKEGMLFGLLGPNGSGKTTTIKILTGQIKPTKGQAFVFGIDVLKDPIKVRELVGIIPEQENPPSFLTAEEYMHFVSKVRKIDDFEKKCKHWFKFLSFEDQKNILCKDLSRGTRQKLMFAQAFLHEPKFAFIDEPIINLDPITQRKIKDFLIDYVKKGNSVLFSTHVLEIAQEICTDIGIIYKGKMAFVGSMKEVKKKKMNLETFFIKLIEGKEHG